MGISSSVRLYQQLGGHSRLYHNPISRGWVFLKFWFLLSQRVCTRLKSTTRKFRSSRISLSTTCCALTWTLNLFRSWMSPSKALVRFQWLKLSSLMWESSKNAILSSLTVCPPFTEPSTRKKIIWISVGVIILVGAVVGLVLGFSLSKGKKTNPAGMCQNFMFKPSIFAT